MFLGIGNIVKFAQAQRHRDSCRYLRCIQWLRAKLFLLSVAFRMFCHLPVSSCQGSSDTKKTSDQTEPIIFSSSAVVTTINASTSNIVVFKILGLLTKGTQAESHIVVSEVGRSDIYHLATCSTRAIDVWTDRLARRCNEGAHPSWFREEARLCSVSCVVSFGVVLHVETIYWWLSRHAMLQSSPTQADTTHHP